MACLRRRLRRRSLVSCVRGLSLYPRRLHPHEYPLANRACERTATAREALARATSRARRATHRSPYPLGIIAAVVTVKAAHHRAQSIHPPDAFLNEDDSAAADNSDDEVTTTTTTTTTTVHHLYSCCAASASTSPSGGEVTLETSAPGSRSSSMGKRRARCYCFPATSRGAGTETRASY